MDKTVEVALITLLAQVEFVPTRDVECVDIFEISRYFGTSLPSDRVVKGLKAIIIEPLS